MPKKVIKRLSTESLLFHSTEKHRVGNLLCFATFLVSKNFMDERRRVEGRSIAFSCKEPLVSHCRKLSQGNPSVNH